MYRTQWRIRRSIIFLSLTFCAIGVGYLIIAGQDTRLHETIASGLLLLAGSVIGSYVFGAVWDDKNVMAHQSDLQPSTTVISTTTGTPPVSPEEAG